VIEGCIKADAVLSAGEAVFSVPSVSLWDADELPAFCSQYLSGKLVYIVPDMDWVDNDQVIQQALFCRTSLRRIGVAAHVAAPPEHAGHKGIDDFLAAGGMIEDLVVVNWPTAPVEFYAGWLRKHSPSRRDALSRDAYVLHSLARYGREEGCVSATVQTLAGNRGGAEERGARDQALGPRGGSRRKSGNPGGDLARLVLRP
jgi:hypothetical protein